MAGSLYQFCVGCVHRKDTKKKISCPARFNPYDADNCPRNGLFIAQQKRIRDNKTKKGRGY